MTPAPPVGQRPPERCPACAEPWRGGRRLEVEDFDSREAMLQNPELQRLSALRYQRCERCGSLVAADLRRDARVLGAAYRHLPADYWEVLSEQNRFADILLRHLEARDAGPELWDVGCGTGTLLERLPETFHKHGVEPGEVAVTAAREQGLDVRRGTAVELGLREVADTCLLIDTAEHLLTPDADLRAIFEMLRPGGLLALFTGRSDSPFARLSGRRWYYLHCVGHVTIFSEDGLRRALERAGFIRIESIHVDHDASAPLGRWLRRFFVSSTRELLGQPAGMVPYFRDHQLVFARRPAQEE